MRNVQCKNCLNLRNEWCEKKCDSPDAEIVRDCEYFRTKTRGDCIRQMSDEELAKFICGLILGRNFGITVEGWLDYLKQEVGEVFQEPLMCGGKRQAERGRTGGYEEGDD